MLLLENNPPRRLLFLTALIVGISQQTSDYVSHPALRPFEL